MTLGHCLSTGKSDCTRLSTGVSLMSPWFQLDNAHLYQQESWAVFCRCVFLRLVRQCAMELPECSCTMSVHLWLAVVLCAVFYNVRILHICCWLACFTLLHPLNILGAVHRPLRSADHRSKTTGRYNYILRGKCARLDKLCVCAEQWDAHIKSPCPLTWLGMSAHLGAHNSSPTIALPSLGHLHWPKAQ